jgi:hypothetical protein
MGFIKAAYPHNSKLNIFLHSAGHLMYSTFSLLQGFGGGGNRCEFLCSDIEVVYILPLTCVFKTWIPYEISEVQLSA